MEVRPSGVRLTCNGLTVLLAYMCQTPGHKDGFTTRTNPLARGSFACLSTDLIARLSCALQWEHVLVGEGKELIQVAEGKSKAARRILPMIPDVLRVMKTRHRAQGHPVKGWVFPTKARTGHLGWWRYRSQHVRTLEKISKAHEADPSLQMIPYFEPYCLRHTALT